MPHKAFALDWNEFEKELLPILSFALQTHVADGLIAYAGANLQALADPYEGKPLASDWQEHLENRDVHEDGEYALKKFYDPVEEHGLGEHWTSLEEDLPKQIRGALLGKPLNLFHPGRAGSYFQDPEQVENFLKALRESSDSRLSAFRDLLQQCARENRGFYVTV